MILNELALHAHELAVEKGFWDKERNISELLMLVVTELGEACEALRNDNRQLEPTIKHVSDTRARGEIICDWKKDTFEDEIADAFIRLADL